MKRILIPILIVIFATSLFAQAKKKPIKKPVKPKSGTVKTTSTTTIVNEQPKANVRPEDISTIDTTSTEKSNSRPGIVKPKEEIYEYYYEFTQPQFTVSKLIIEHHENGKGNKIGTICFLILFSFRKQL
jgi:hypothetical protein